MVLLNKWRIRTIVSCVCLRFYCVFLSVVCVLACVFVFVDECECMAGIILYGSSEAARVLQVN